MANKLVDYMTTLEAAKIVAEESDLPWCEVQKYCTTLQRDKADGAGLIPTSIGRSLARAEPAHVVRLLMAIGATHIPAHAPPYVRSLMKFKFSAAVGQMTARGGPSLEAVLINMLSGSKKMEFLDYIVFEPDNHYVGVVFRYSYVLDFSPFGLSSHQPDADQPVITRCGVVPGSVFRKLRARLGFGKDHIDPDIETRFDDYMRLAFRDRMNLRDSGLDHISQHAPRGQVGRSDLP